MRREARRRRLKVKIDVESLKLTFIVGQLVTLRSREMLLVKLTVKQSHSVLLILNPSMNKPSVTVDTWKEL